MTWKELRKLDREQVRDQLLEGLGLQTRREVGDWLFPALGLLAAGVVIGTGLGMLFAPKAGEELRHDLSQRLNAGRERAATKVEQELRS